MRIPVESRGLFAGLTRDHLVEAKRDLPRVKRRLPKTLADGDFDRIRTWIDRTFKDVPGFEVRWALYRVLLELLWDGALRRSEVILLGFDCVDHEKGLLRVQSAPDAVADAWLTKKIGPLAKTGERQIPIAPSTLQWINRWRIQFRPPESLLRGEGRLLTQWHPDRLGVPLTIAFVDELFSLLNDHVLMDKRVSPHLLRHTWATNALKAGVTLQAIQYYLGHARLASTENYLHLENPDVRQELAAYRSRYQSRYQGPPET